MKTLRLSTILLIAIAILATGCDSRTLLGALLGPGPDGGAEVTAPQVPAIVTATPNAAGQVVVVTATPGVSADAVVKVDQLNLRAGTSVAFRIVAILRRGDLLTVIGRNGNFGQGRSLWLRVRTTDGLDGWVASWLLDINVDVDTVPILATPVPPPTPVPTAVPTPSGPTIEFWADRTNLNPGECTTIHWRTALIRAVYFDGMGVVGVEDRVVCPGSTQTFTLRVIKQDNAIEERTITIFVGNSPYVNFRADRTQIGPSECTTVRWDVEGVKAVYFEGMGVIGHSNAHVCPGATKTYTLRVIWSDDSSHEHYLTIEVSSAYGP